MFSKKVRDLKILFIISSLSSGGAERTLTLIANELVERGYEVSILTLCKSEIFYEISKNIKLVELNLCGISTNIFQTLARTFKMIINIRNLIKELSPDIAISFMNTTNILLLLAGAGLKSKKIITEHIDNSAIAVPLKQTILQRLIYPFTDMLISVSKGIEQNFSFLPLTSKKVVNNPIHTEILSKSDQNTDEISIEKYGKYIIAVGRLEEQKQFNILIQSFLPLKEKEISLLIFGDGSLKNELQLLINNLTLNDKVFLMGRVKNPYYFMQRAQFLVLSSKYEGFGNVLIEAMACGCPCISFDCPSGPGEIIDNNISGLLVENQNIEKLTEAMQKLLDDKNLRNRLSFEAKKIKDRYSIEKIASAWEDLIYKLTRTQYELEK